MALGLLKKDDGDETPDGVTVGDRLRGTERLLSSILVLPWNEAYTDAHIDYIASAIQWAASQL